MIVPKIKERFLSSPTWYSKTLWIGDHLNHLPANYVLRDYLYYNPLMATLQVLSHKS
nr:MAG TPA: hypothetical protein [Caudoviricetes sp.]